jgi:hypothetical protein
MGAENKIRFPGPLSVFQERRLPERATPAGYAALIPSVNGPLVARLDDRLHHNRDRGFRIASPVQHTRGSCLDHPSPKGWVNVRPSVDRKVERHPIRFGAAVTGQLSWPMRANWNNSQPIFATVSMT